MVRIANEALKTATSHIFKDKANSLRDTKTSAGLGPKTLALDAKAFYFSIVDQPKRASSYSTTCIRNRGFLLLYCWPAEESEQLQYQVVRSCLEFIKFNLSSNQGNELVERAIET